MTFVCVLQRRAVWNIAAPYQGSTCVALGVDGNVHTVDIRVFGKD